MKSQIPKDEIVMSISSDAFSGIRWSFDNVLAAVLKKMKIRDADTAQINLKIDIKLDSIKTTDARTGEVMNLKNPKISYKVTHKLEYKSEDSEGGEIQQADSYLYCDNKGQWTIRRIEDGQMTIADYVQQGGKE